MTRVRRGVILPIVLVVIGLMALTMAGFVFFIRAETAGLAAYGDMQQARLAAESGLEEIIAQLRISKHDLSTWHNVPTRFRYGLVYSPSFDRERDPVRQAATRAGLLVPGANPSIAWRYAAVAPLRIGALTQVRYGITPESSKLNINTATDAQIEQLLAPLLVRLRIENSLELVAALLDWRDPDSDARPGGAENSWYNTLTPPYNAKNGPFDTIEELLLVKGFSAAVLWGEDANRNGILDPNEDDGEVSFPYYDNADGILDQGIAPFLTVFSREPDTAIDNKRRINLNMDVGAIQLQIAEQIAEGQLSQATIDFIVQLKGGGFNFSQLGSPAELYTQGLPPPVIGGGEGADEEAGGESASQPSFGPGTPRFFEQLQSSPVTLQELPILMDRFSTIDPQRASQGLYGLIHLATAPAEVLSVIPGITPEAVAAIVGTRGTLPPAELVTTAWPLASGAVDVATFHAIAPHVTAKSYQFHVEILGYADHTRTARRFEWIIEMIGPLAQVKYTRELTALGLAWPIDDDTITVGATQ